MSLAVFVVISTAESIPLIRKTVSEVQLAVVATDGSGRPVPSLVVSDIAVLEDDRRIPIFELRSASNLPLRVGIVLDLSDSTQTTWRTTRAAVTDFLRQFTRPGDQVFILAFDSTVRLKSTVTDPQQLEHMIPSPPAGGLTALFDAVYSACQHDMFSQAGEARRSALIVFSDGEDNLSRHDLDETIEKAELMGIAVYTISTHKRHVKYPGDAVLHRLAATTGGRDFVVRESRELRDALMTISGELRSFYLLYYRPPNGSREREFRRVRVLPTQNNGPRIRHRGGYFTAPEPANEH